MMLWIHREHLFTIAEEIVGIALALQTGNSHGGRGGEKIDAGKPVARLSRYVVRRL